MHTISTHFLHTISSYMAAIRHTRHFILDIIHTSLNTFLKKYIILSSYMAANDTHDISYIRHLYRYCMILLTLFFEFYVS